MCCARAAMQHVFSVAAHVHVLLDGATDPDPAQHGLTTHEERAACHTPQATTSTHYKHYPLVSHGPATCLLS